MKADELKDLIECFIDDYIDDHVIFKYHGKIHAELDNILEEYASIKCKELEQQLEQEREPNKGDIKHYCTKFFYWWFNNKGTNTEQGFDKWWLENGQFMQLTSKT